MEERVGAYIIDPDGNAVPDLSDEAMAARQKSEVETGLKPVCTAKTISVKSETVDGTNIMSAAAKAILR